MQLSSALHLFDGDLQRVRHTSLARMAADLHLLPSLHNVLCLHWLQAMLVFYVSGLGITNATPSNKGSMHR